MSMVIHNAWIFSLLLSKYSTLLFSFTNLLSAGFDIFLNLKTFNYTRMFDFF